MGKVTERVLKMARPFVEARGLDLIDVEYQKEGDNWYLRVFIENPDSKLSLKDCEDISRMLSPELDEEDLIDRSYILEVSSPGLERPLKTAKDFLDHREELIQVKTYASIDGQKEFSGILKDFNTEKEIVILNTDEGVMEIPLSKIAHAHLLLDF